MAKIIAWLIVIFLVLFALRLIGVRNMRRRAAAQQGPPKPIGEPMVKCLRCGVFMPKEEARAVDGGYACAGDCAKG